MTADDAREALPAWGDIKDTLESSGVKVSDKQSQDFLDYLIQYMADDLEDEDDIEDDDIDDELDDELEEDAKEDVDRA